MKATEIILLVSLLLVAISWLWLYGGMEHYKHELEKEKTMSEIQRKASEAEIFSKDQLIKIKEPVKHEEVNLSIGTHKLVF